MKNKKIIIPNFVTSLNILSGSMAILLSFEGQTGLLFAGILIFLASIFDFLDGFIARMLKATSEFGKQLDSLADMISFGLAPSFIIYHLIYNSLNITTTFLQTPFPKILILFIPFIIVIFSALRLAKFNIDDSQKTVFAGLPTPALAIFVASLPLILKINPQNIIFCKIFNLDFNFIPLIIENTFFLIFITLFLSTLLVVRLRMFSLKPQGFKFKNNKIIYIFLIFSVLLLILFQILAIPLIIFTYIIISIFTNNLKNIISKSS